MARPGGPPSWGGYGWGPSLAVDTASADGTPWWAAELGLKGALPESFGG